MNVAILVKEFPPDVIGGTETQTFRMAGELQQRGHDVTVYTKAYPESDTLDPEFDLVRVPNWRYTSVTSTATFLLGAIVYLLWNHRRHDVLQCMMVYPNGFAGYILEIVTGLPSFAWIRGGDYYFMKDTFGKRWMIRQVVESQLVLVQTQSVREDVLSEFPGANLRILGNGVDIPGETADGDAVIFVGRLKKQKGVSVLLRALEGLDQRLFIVGDGPERGRLESLAASLEVDVTFTGEVSPNEVGKYLRRGTVFVLPSIRGEGLPNAVLEAMAVGLPVIGTATGGVADAILEGETGFVIPPGSEELLRDRIHTICNSEELQNRMGRNARRYVEDNHSWATVLSKLECIYDLVTDRNNDSVTDVDP